jgi:hypothetical protein
MYVDEIKRLICVLQNGTICVYRLEGKTAILDQLVKNDMIQDKENKKLTSNIVCSCLASNFMIKYDCEKHYEENRAELALYQ